MLPEVLEEPEDRDLELWKDNKKFLCSSLPPFIHSSICSFNSIKKENLSWIWSLLKFIFHFWNLSNILDRLFLEHPQWQGAHHLLRQEMLLWAGICLPLTSPSGFSPSFGINEWLLLCGCSSYGCRQWLYIFVGPYNSKGVFLILFLFFPNHTVTFKSSSESHPSSCFLMVSQCQ